MSQSAAWFLIFFAVVLAIGIDLYLMRLVRVQIQKRLKENPAKAEGVYVFGAYSPILSWLKKLWNASLQLEAVATSPSIQPKLMQSEQRSADGGVLLGLRNIVIWLSRQREGFYLILLTVGVLFFCRGILSLRTDLQLPGNESGNFQAVMQYFVQSLLQDHRLPAWNPYFRTGLPYLADPMLHIYNPVVTLPSLLFGVRIGYRIALVFSYLIAAIGMMRLGRAFGLGKLVSLWLGFMYVFAGQPTARFFQGEYLFVFGFAWIPWVFYFLVRHWQTREFKKLVYFAFALALLYLSGNAYYPFLLFWLLLIFVFLFMVRVLSQPIRLEIDGRFLVSMLIALALGGGLIALHFLPMLQSRPYLVKGEDVQGSHTLWQIWLDYTSRDTFREDAYTALPAREEFYAYIGYMPFFALALLPFGWQKGRRRWIAYWIAVIAFVVMWVNVDQMPWRNYFYQTAFFSQFRHVLRPLIFGSFAIFLLGAFGLDGVEKRLIRWMENAADGGSGKVRRVICGLGFLGLIGLMGYGVYDVYRVNHPYLSLDQDDLAAYRITRWLREHDPSEYYVRRNPANSWHLPMLTARLKYIDAWYAFTLIEDRSDTDLAKRPVRAQPLYILQAENDPPPDGRWHLVTQIEGTTIYKMRDSLPIVFKTALSALQANPQEELRSEEVTPLTPFFKNDTVEIIAQATEQEVLVVLISYFPGWRVKIDGRRAQLEQVGGYLAVKMEEGIHKYRFEFRPTVFYWGLTLSLISLSIGLFLIRSDVIAFGQKIWNLLPRVRDAWVTKMKIWAQRRVEKSLIHSAVYREGAFVVESEIGLEEGCEANLIVIPNRNSQMALPWLWNAWKQLAWLVVQSSLSAVSMTAMLFILSILIYFATRIVGLSDFPIYFFTDEAIQTASAAELVRNGFYGPGKVFLPTYFPNGSYWNLSLSVYVQVLPYLLFGKSVWVTRWTSLMVSGLMVLVLANALRKTVCPRAWWSFLLFLAVTPTWFLHSRTAFETVIFSGFYAAFLGAYLLYIQHSPRYLYWAILMAGLAFYAYSPGQVIIAVTAVALLALDFRYHWQNRALLGKGMLLIGLLAVPYLRFLSYHQEAPLQHLRNLDSYWFYDLPITEKIGRYLKEYLMGLSPSYWFIPHSIDLNRHTMKGYGHLGFWNLPFILLGLIFAIRQWRKPSLRVFLVAFLAVPTGAALVGVGITRLLAMVIPMAVFAALGWEWVLSTVQEVRRQKVIQVALFVLFSAVSFSMTRDSLQNGPTWYDDYGLYGMQYGTRQIFEQKIPQYLHRYPDSQLFVSSLWANGADVFVRYFLTPEQAQRVNMGSIDSYLSRKQPLDERTVFFLTAEEFRAALASPKMRFIRMEEEVSYPNGKTGFYIVRLAYVDNVDEIFARERELRHQLLTAHVVVDDISVAVRYSQIDAGRLGDLFDQDKQTLIRGREANPFILEFQFVQPQLLKGIQAQFGSMDFELVLYLYPEGQTEPIELRQEYRGLPPDPSVELLFPQEMSLAKMRIEVRDLNYGEIANIHIRELKFLR